MSDSSNYRWKRRSFAVWTFGLVTMLILAVALALAPGPVRADPKPNKDQLRSKIDKLTTRAEVVTEKYNGQKLELRKARKAVRQARKRSARTQQRMQRVSDALSELAANRYKSGGLGAPMEVFGAKRPRALMGNATMLSHLSQQKVARLQERRTAADRAARAQRQRQRATKKAKSLTADLNKKKKRIEGLVSDAKQRLAKLQPEGGSAPSPVDVGDVGSGTAAQALQVALDQQGDPYVWGAAGPDSFDCSGLVAYAFKKEGIALPHYTGKLWRSGTHVSRSELRPGDLVFTSPHHVGMYVGNGKMVDAPHSGTVVQVEDIYDYYGGVRVT